MNVAAVTTKLALVGGPKVQLAVAKVSKFSPQILTAVGIVGGVASTVMIAKATLQLESVLTKHEEDKHSAKSHFGVGDIDEKERDKLIRRAYVSTCLDLAKVYGPGVSLGVASIVSVVAGQGIAQKRQVGLVAAVKSAESALQAYRARVIEAIGEDKEAEIRYGVTTETVEDETGKKTKVKVFNPNGLTDYQFMYDETNRNWQRGNRELNYLHLKNIQNWSNDRLNHRGYLYLNEVLGFLGMDDVPQGQVVGWLHKDLDNGDGYVDLGWDNIVNRPSTKFGEPQSGILLDFNVDGEINSKL